MHNFLRKYDVFPLIAAGVVFSSLGLAACGVNSAGNETVLGIDTKINAANFQSTVTSDITDTLNTVCPVVGVLQASPPANMSAFQKASLTQLENACPPNPPPTNIVVGATDLLAAYQALAPLVHGNKPPGT